MHYSVRYLLDFDPKINSANLILMSIGKSGIIKFEFQTTYSKVPIIRTGPIIRTVLIFLGTFQIYVPYDLKK